MTGEPRIEKECVPMQSASLKTGPVARSTLVTNSPRLLTFTQDCFVSILFVILSICPQSFGKYQELHLFPDRDLRHAAHPVRLVHLGRRVSSLVNENA